MHAPNQGYALLEYEKSEEAQSTITSMNRDELLDKNVSVDWAFSNGPSVGSHRRRNLRSGRSQRSRSPRRLYGLYDLVRELSHFSPYLGFSLYLDQIREAEDLMSEVPGGPGVSMLQSMLGSCRLHGNVKMGAKVAELAMEMKLDLSSSYVPMYNIYAEKGQ